MNSTSYREFWEKDFQRRREGLIEISSWDPFEKWELNTAPESSAEDYLLYGLEILYGHGDAELARRFLEHCLLIAEQTLAEDKLQSPRCRDSFPENRGALIRARTYAKAILGNPLEDAALLEASTDFEQTCARYPKHKWDDFQEDTYLVAVRLAIISGDGERAQRLLTRRRVLRWQPEQDELLRGLVSSLQVSPFPSDVLFHDRFKAYFDRVRDPNFHPEEFTQVQILRLEVGALYDKYFVSSDNKIDWQRTIDAIAE